MYVIVRHDRGPQLNATHVYGPYTRSDAVELLRVVRSALTRSISYHVREKENGLFIFVRGPGALAWRYTVVEVQPPNEDMLEGIVL